MFIHQIAISHCASFCKVLLIFLNKSSGLRNYLKVKYFIYIPDGKSLKGLIIKTE